MVFRGWPPQAHDFYVGLEADNTKAFWLANKTVYEEAVRAPMDLLAAEVADEFGLLHLFRPYRDVRFSKDKTPYKTHIGAVTEGEGGESYYVQFSSEGIFAGSGYYQMARDQLHRFTEAVASDDHGPELVDIVARLRKGRYEVGGSALKTAPRGYPKDHPRVELLRHKGLFVGKSCPPAKWHSTRAALGRITDIWRAGAPANDWLNNHVGPSTEIPPDARD